MRRMTIVIEMADDSALVGAAAAPDCHCAPGEGTDRRRGNERRGSGQAAAPSSTAARPYGFRSFRDRRSDAGERVAPAPAFSAGRPFRPAPPPQEQIRLRVAAAYGDGNGDDGASAIFHRVDLCL